ncbi:MAG: hypothetical protein K2J04_09675 [Lachnospiraceae bacterium]|nr:hypothetical protein [Lachnospiraceae bacterium]
MIKRIYWIYALCIMLTLTGCSSSASSAENTVTASGDVTIGNYLTIQNIDSRLMLLSNLDALSADGLYYASWVIGDAQAFENSDGDTVDLYDASLYLLSGEFKNTQYAQENMDSWLAAAKENYEVLNEEDITCNGQTYSLITYNSTHEDNPYARGISAFGVHENHAVCIELTCLGGFNDDLRDILVNFLECCSYE